MRPHFQLNQYKITRDAATLELLDLSKLTMIEFFGEQEE